jgi:hypothetical protein
VRSVSAGARRQAPPHQLHVLITGEDDGNGMVLGGEERAAAFDRRAKAKGDWEGEAGERRRRDRFGLCGERARTATGTRTPRANTIFTFALALITRLLAATVP